MNKTDQFIAWLCGEKVRFPYFQNPVEVPMPIMPMSEEAKDKSVELEIDKSLEEKHDI